MRFILISLVILLATSCSVNSSKLSDSYAKDFANDITYAKDDRTGLCFGFVASRKTGSTDSTGIGMTRVPCSDVQHLIK